MNKEKYQFDSDPAGKVPKRLVRNRYTWKEIFQGRLDMTRGCVSARIGIVYVLSCDVRVVVEHLRGNVGALAHVLTGMQGRALHLVACACQGACLDEHVRAWGITKLPV